MGVSISRPEQIAVQHAVSKESDGRAPRHTHTHIYTQTSIKENERQVDLSFSMLDDDDAAKLSEYWQSWALVCCVTLLRLTEHKQSAIIAHAQAHTVHNTQERDILYTI